MKNRFTLFQTARVLNARIAEYFNWIKGEYHIELLPFKPTARSPSEMREQKVWDREPQRATLTGLAHYLGFDSRDSFEAYEKQGLYKKTLRRARLQIEAEYEKQLLNQPSTGAMFALKYFGWADRSASKIADTPPTDTNLKIEIVNTGPAPAAQEQEVSM